MATNNYMPMGRNPRNPAGQNAGYKKGGMTKIAGVMGKGGVKYQGKGAVTAVKAGAVAAGSAVSKAAALAASKAAASAARPMMKKIVKIKR